MDIHMQLSASIMAVWSGFLRLVRGRLLQDRIPLACGWGSVGVWVAAGVAMAGTAMGMEPAADFKQNCMSCHTVGGGRLVGPDLKDVTERKDREWLTRFILDPKS